MNSNDTDVMTHFYLLLWIVLSFKGDEDSKKDQKMKKKRKEDKQTSDGTVNVVSVYFLFDAAPSLRFNFSSVIDGGTDSNRVVKTVLERWRESLQSCCSLSQVRAKPGVTVRSW